MNENELKGGGGGIDGSENCPNPKILGTNDNDTLLGTAGEDIIDALAGDDDIIADAGDDLLCGGSGDDTIVPEGGEDTVFAERGDDRIDPLDDEADFIDCGPGTDDVIVDAVDTTENCETEL